MLGSLLKNMTFFLTDIAVDGAPPSTTAEIVYPDQVAETAFPQYSAWPSAVVIGLCVVLACVCLALTVIILLQKKRASGIGAAIGGSAGDTYWSKNKGKSVDGTLEKYTKWGGAAFIIVALLINILM